MKPTMRLCPVFRAVLCVLCVLGVPLAHAQVAIRAGKIYTMTAPAGAGKFGTPSANVIEDGTIYINVQGKIEKVGKASEVVVPAGTPLVTAAVATPGLVDPRGILGLSGLYNTPHDQDQLERSGPIQPELRALDAYNPQEPLIEYARSFGITTAHTGHAPGELISGQTIVVKLRGATVEEALLKSPAMVAATIGPWAQRSSSPGTRGKQVAMLREELLRARDYAKGRAGEPVPEPAEDPAKSDDPKDKAKKDGRNLRMEMLSDVLAGKTPLIVTANRAQDIATALRLREEFGLTLVLDMAAEAYVVLDQIKTAGVAVILHPTMFRATGDAENLSFETASKLVAAGVPVAIQSGYESYVPKTRIVLFEAALAAANGLSFEAALATITSDAAKIIGVADRVGSLAPGKDGDVALYDGDPFEYTTRCTAVIIDGKTVSSKPR